MKKQKLLILSCLLLSFGLLSACGLIKPSEKEAEIELIELKEPSQLIELSQSNNQFGFAIFLAEAKETDNLFISPYSLSTALTMAYLGSDEETKTELAEALKLTAFSQEKLKMDSLALKNYLENISKTTQLSIANAFFLKEGIPFLDSYVQTGQNYFKAKIDQLPSQGQIINDWVMAQTNDKILDLIDPGPIDPLVIAYLVNAIYFKANWSQEFDPNLTSQRPFYGYQQEKIIDMMERKGDYRYLKRDNLEAISLDYQDGQYLFYAFMPDDLNDFYQNLNQTELDKLQAEMITDQLTVRLPKFKLEEKLALKETLEAIGLELAFQPALANFSKMVDLDLLDDNVYISQVYHSSFIEVDEQGTEAAAATAVEMRLEMAILDPLIIEFNRPFIFLIQEKDTGAILFLGQLVDFVD